jgi:hypothetical protein
MTDTVTPNLALSLPDPEEMQQWIESKADLLDEILNVASDAGTIASRHAIEDARQIGRELTTALQDSRNLIIALSEGMRVLEQQRDSMIDDYENMADMHREQIAEHMQKVAKLEQDIQDVMTGDGWIAQSIIEGHAEQEYHDYHAFLSSLRAKGRHADADRLETLQGMYFQAREAINEIMGKQPAEPEFDLDSTEETE